MIDAHKILSGLSFTDKYDMKKILVISDWAPPMIDGPSMILGNLLREFKKDDVVLFKRKINRNTNTYSKKGNELNIKEYSLFVPTPYFPGLSNFWRRVFRLLETLFIPLTVIKGLWVCAIEGIDCILATSDAPHAHFLTSAYLIAKIAKKRLVLYLLDPVEEFQMGRIQKNMVNMFLPRMMRYSSKVIVMNDVLAEHYNSKFGIKCEVLPHSVDINSNRCDPENAKREQSEKIKIIFSGKISKYQEDALLNLINAIKRSPKNIILKIFTPTKPSYLKQLGFDSANVTIKYIDHDDLKGELKKADILFIPLSFINSGSMIVKAAFPVKIMDYLLAQRPILINAPGDSFIVKFAKDNKIAEIVTENDADAVAKAIDDLINNSEKRDTLILNCQKTVINYEPRIIFERFSKIVKDL